MKSHHFLALTAFSFLTASAPVLADYPSAASKDAHRLKAEAEQIMDSNPNVKSVTIHEEVAPKYKEGARIYNFEDMDINKDGVFSRDEVGESLFRIFDQDGNEVIDNIEMKKPSLLVITSMERKTVDIIEYRSEAAPVKETVRYDQFMQTSKLAQFDHDRDGLSPLDFVGKSFYEINVKEDAVIDLEEWKRAYAESVKPLHMEAFNYNED